MVLNVPLSITLRNAFLPQKCHILSLIDRNTCSELFALLILSLLSSLNVHLFLLSSDCNCSLLFSRDNGQSLTVPVFAGWLNLILYAWSFVLYVEMN